MFWEGIFVLAALCIGLLFGFGWGIDYGRHKGYKEGMEAEKKASYRRKDLTP